MSYERQPLVIGATGGSGTRLVASIARHAGFFMGSNLNHANDAKEFVGFYDRWINRWLNKQKMPFSVGEQTQMAADFEDCVRRHRAHIPCEVMAWGWKNPRSIYLLEFFEAQRPEMKFLHVIRDGRDMAYAKNQNQLKKHRKALLDNKVLKGEMPLCSIALWNRVNLAAARYGETQMRSRYLRIRFEDLCARPNETIERIYQFLGARDADAAVAVAEIAPPDSIGRWTRQDPTQLAEIRNAGQGGLEHFGYVEEGIDRL